MSTCHPQKIPTSWTLLKDRWNVKNNPPVFFSPMVFSYHMTWPPPHLSYAKMDSKMEEPKHKGVSEASSVASVLFPRRHTLAYMPTVRRCFLSNGRKRRPFCWFVFVVFLCSRCLNWHNHDANLWLLPRALCGKYQVLFYNPWLFLVGGSYDAVDFLCNSTSVCRSVMPSCLASTSLNYEANGW